MTEELKQICKEVLTKVIYQIRNQGSVAGLVYTYYVSDPSQMVEKNKIIIKKDFDSLKIQIRRKILTQCNNYWGLEDSKVKAVEDLVLYHEDEFDTLKDMITDLFGADMKAQRQAMEKAEEDSKAREFKQFKEVLKDRYDMYKDVCYKIIHDDREFACKSDKIKIFLEIGLDVDSITLLLLNYEKWIVQRSYVEKYRKERHQAILEGKIKKYEPQSVIENVLKRLHNVQ